MRPTWLFLVIVELAACGRDARTSSNAEAAMPQHAGGPIAPPSTPDAAAAAAQATDRDIDITGLNASARVRVKLPASWSASEISVVLRDQYQEAIAGVQFTVICNAGCSDDDIARMPQVVDQTFDTRVRPNVNTGDPAMDAVRLKLEIVDQGEVPGGKFRVARVTRPAGLQGPYRDELYAVCVRAKRGAKIVEAQAWAPLAREQELGPVVVTACKTFEIL
jgi:hypothetical protein